MPPAAEGYVVAIDLGTACLGIAIRRLGGPGDVHCIDLSGSSREQYKMDSDLIFWSDSPEPPSREELQENRMDLGLTLPLNVDLERGFQVFLGHKMYLYSANPFKDEREPPNIGFPALPEVPSITGEAFPLFSVLRLLFLRIKVAVMQYFFQALGGVSNVLERCGFVVTVPAIATQEAVNFMRMLLQDTMGTQSRFYRVVREPEAAIVHSLLYGGGGAGANLRSGDIVAVLDIGGGTSDFVVMRFEEIQNPGRGEERFRLTRLEPTRGIAAGGVYLDFAFYRLFLELIGIGQEEMGNRYFIMRETFRAFREQKVLLGRGRNGDRDGEGVTITLNEQYWEAFRRLAGEAAFDAGAAAGAGAGVHGPGDGRPNRRGERHAERNRGQDDGPPGLASDRRTFQWLCDRVGAFNEGYAGFAGGDRVGDAPGELPVTLCVDDAEVNGIGDLEPQAGMPEPELLTLRFSNRFLKACIYSPLIKRIADEAESFVQEAIRANQGRLDRVLLAGGFIDCRDLQEELRERVRRATRGLPRGEIRPEHVAYSSTAIVRGACFLCPAGWADDGGDARGARAARDVHDARRPGAKRREAQKKRQEGAETRRLGGAHGLVTFNRPVDGTYAFQCNKPIKSLSSAERRDPRIRWDETRTIARNALETVFDGGRVDDATVLTCLRDEFRVFPPRDGSDYIKMNIFKFPLGAPLPVAAPRLKEADFCPVVFRIPLRDADKAQPREDHRFELLFSWDGGLILQYHRIGGNDGVWDALLYDGSGIARRP